MDTDTIIRQLEYEADKHKNDRLFTGQTDITAMCRDLIPKMKELKRYEDLTQDGRLLELPCKVGDYVWDNDFGRPCAYEVTGFSFGNLNEDYCDEDVTVFDQLLIYYSNSSGSITGRFAISEIGKTVFLTKEAAEAALKEMEGRV